MPNWCANSISVTHQDPQQIDAMIAAYQQGRLLEHFVPLPDGEWNYDFCLSHWGTKWDVGGPDATWERLDPHTVELSFDSAWSPPAEVYEQMCTLGFEIDARYWEPGMAFCGRFTGNAGGHQDDYREYSNEDADSVRHAVGDDLDDFWGISESMEQWDEPDGEHD